MMKNNKWLRITLTAILTLTALAAVAGAGYWAGISQSANFSAMTELRAQRWEQAQKSGGVPRTQTQPMMPGGRDFNPHAFNSMRSFDHDSRMRGFDRHDGFFFPFFGLLGWVVIGALLWLGYKYVKDSGWRLVKETPAVPVQQDGKPAE